MSAKDTLLRQSMLRIANMLALLCRYDAMTKSLLNEPARATLEGRRDVTVVSETNCTGIAGRNSVRNQCRLSADKHEVPVHDRLPQRGKTTR
jgi:hypothetical protein